MRRFGIKRLVDGAFERVLDTVAAEEPLEIRVSYWFKNAPLSESLSLTMRTPGQDRELAVGLLFSEGVIRSPDDLVGTRMLGGDGSNELLVELSKEVDFDAWKLARSGFVSSSCGLCGRRSIDHIAQDAPPPPRDAFCVDASLIEALPHLLQSNQKGFVQTGGLHAAALVSHSGQLQCLFEDIGRHNALDKLIGWSFLNGRLPLRDSVVFLSSRSSFELIQKSIMAEAPVLATIGGPSSLAIETSREHGLTLIGFVRENRFNIYSGDWRIKS